VAGKSLASVESECDERCADWSRRRREGHCGGGTFRDTILDAGAGACLAIASDSCLVAMVPSAVRPRERRNQHTYLSIKCAILRTG